MATVVFITPEQWEVKCRDGASTIGPPGLPSFSRLFLLGMLPMEALTGIYGSEKTSFLMITWPLNVNINEV